MPVVVLCSNRPYAVCDCLRQGLQNQSTPEEGERSVNLEEAAKEYDQMCSGESLRADWKKDM